MTARSSGSTTPCSSIPPSTVCRQRVVRIDGPGPTVAGGMLFLTSGYAHLGFGLAGNVLLTFGVD